jgi:hypothetical protein
VSVAGRPHGITVVVAGSGRVGPRTRSLEEVSHAKNAGNRTSATVCYVRVVFQGHQVLQFVPQVRVTAGKSCQRVCRSWFQRVNVCLTSFGFREFPVIVGLFLFNEVVFTPLGPLINFMGSVVSRRYEFQADAFACGLGMKRPLQTGLVKVSIKYRVSQLLCSLSDCITVLHGLELAASNRKHGLPCCGSSVFCVSLLAPATC